MRTPSLRLSILAAFVALAGVFAVGSAVAEAQQDPCEPLQGTIQVVDDAPNMNELAQVTENQARDAALSTLAGASVTEIDLDEEDGFLVYEVDLILGTEEHEVFVDAGSGEVLCTQRED